MEPFSNSVSFLLATAAKSRDGQSLNETRPSVIVNSSFFSATMFCCSSSWWKESHSDDLSLNRDRFEPLVGQFDGCLSNNNREIFTMNGNLIVYFEIHLIRKIYPACRNWYRHRQIVLENTKQIDSHSLFRPNARSELGNYYNFVSYSG